MPFALAPLAFPSLLLATAGMPVDLPAPPAGETLRLDAPPPAPSTDGAPRALRLPRAGLELAGVLALGAVWYEAELDFNGRDFDFERSWSSQWTKLVDGRGYRFDDNDRTTNIAHAFVGRTYHGIARTNLATMWQAVLFDLTASSLWESCIESKEVFSINDTIVTGIGGISLGESAFQLGELFARSAPTWRNRLLLTLFSPARAFLALTEGGPSRKAHSVDSHGIDDDVYHRFALSAGGSFAATPSLGTPVAAPPAGGMSAGNFAARLDMELVNLRSYGREGTAQRNLSGGEATAFSVGYQGTAERLDELTVAARTSLFGRYDQNVIGDDRDRRGGSLLLAAGSAFDLGLTEGQRTADFVTAVHMIGPTADALIYRGPLTLRLSSDVYGDFAMVRPFALGPDTPASVMDGAKSVLREHDYYYAMGLTAAARAEARYAGVRAGAAFEWSGYDSIQGLDRAQDAYIGATGAYHAGVTDDFAIGDQRMKVRVYTELPTPIDDVHLGLSFDLQHRSGEMKDLTRSEDEGRAAAVLSFVM
jgi:hypothetical protein